MCRCMLPCGGRRAVSTFHTRPRSWRQRTRPDASGARCHCSHRIHHRNAHSLQLLCTKDGASSLRLRVRSVGTPNKRHERATMLKVTVKWQKETFDIEVDTAQPPALFKAQLESLTGVPAERQKIMVKGGLLRDDADWSSTGLKDGAKLMMMGTAEKPIEAPKQRIEFVEDLPEAEQAAQDTRAYGAGLTNLGNTCYMNATVQCLFRVPELRQALQGLTDGGATGSLQRMALSTRGLFQALESSKGPPVTPMAFLAVLRDMFPQFAQTGAEGMPMQQDAEECWTGLLNVLSQRVDAAHMGDGAPPLRGLFEIGFEAKLTCAGTGETWEERTSQLMLKCNINQSVNHLLEGIKVALEEKRERASERLGRTADWEGQSRISRLPPWLTVHMVRFFYKVDVQQKAKILRKVGFPVVLDLYDVCTEAVQKELDGPRAALKEVEDLRVHRKNLGKAEAKGEAGAAEAVEGEAKRPKTEGAAKEGDVDMEGGRGGEGATTAAGVAPGELSVEAVAMEGRMTGRYELAAVLTHKGRSADSGHYVAWCKQADGSWVLYDDDDLTVRKEEEILALAGGGDWHMAYLLLYRAQRVPKASEV